MKTYITNSAKETQVLAQKLAKNLSARIFLLDGDLGSGKTIFVQGFAKGLGIKDKIISPTFVLIREHQVPNSLKKLYHIDLYRIKKTGDLGLEEIINNKNNIVLLEWAERLEELPKDSIKINITKSEDQNRIIIIS